MNPRRAFAIAILVAAVLGSGPAAAVWSQSNATTGTLRGTATDPKGASVPEAKVTARNQETRYTRETQTGDDGYFNIPLLPVGAYELRVEKAGFATLVHSDIPVSVGGVTVINVELKLGAASEVVEVKAAAPLVETTRTQVSSVVDETAVSTLPLHGRNYLDFVLLTPGVVRDSSGARAGDINFGGLKGTYNSLQIDGVDNNNNFFGQSLGRTGSRAPFQFSQEAVAEFQVKTNSYAAEYGRAGGAVINVVTKSGANALHGAVFGYYRANGLNANKWEFNRIAKPKPPLRVWQFGANASGPLVRDKAFWLFDYDAQRRGEPNPVCITAACQPAKSDAFLGPLIQDYQKKLDQDVFLGKGDWRITSNHNLSIRYNYQRFTGGSLENSGDTSVRQHTGDSLVHTQTLSGNLVSTFGRRWINEFRAQWGRDAEPGMANSTAPEIQLPFLQLGRNNFSPRETTINRGQFVDNLSYLRGRHSFKFGVDFNLERILNFFPGLFGGRYSYGSLGAFQGSKVGGTPTCSSASCTYTQNFAGAGTTGPTTHPDITEYSWFAEDEFRALPNLTLTFGVRYDLQTNAKPSIVNPDAQLAALGVNTGQMNTSTTNFAPRLGFAWSPQFHRSFVVRGGYGIYYARTPAILIATATSNNGLQVISITLRGDQLPPPGLTYPNTLSAPPTGATPAPASLYVFQKNYTQPYVQQGSLGVEIGIAKDWSLGATYLLVKGTHLTRSNDINLGPAAPCTYPISTGGSLTVQRFPTTLGCSGGSQVRPASHFGRITEFESNANSIYHAVAFTMNKRFSQHFQLAANYTLSKAIDDKPDSTSVVPGNPGDELKMAQGHFGFRDDRGLSDQDYRHRFVCVGLWTLDYLNKHDNLFVRSVFGYWSLSTVFTAQNGRRWSIQTSGDPNADGNGFTDRVPGIARNTRTLPRQVSADIRVARDIPIYERLKATLMFEAFNVFNHPNFRDVNSFAGQGAIQYNLAKATGTTTTSNCPIIGTTCFFPLASFTPANPKNLFVGTYDMPGGGSNFPGPGPRTLQVAIKLTW